MFQLTQYSSNTRYPLYLCERRMSGQKQMTTRRNKQAQGRGRQKQSHRKGMQRKKANKMTQRFSWRFYIHVLSNIYKEKHIIFTGKMMILELLLVNDKFVVKLIFAKELSFLCTDLFSHSVLFNSVTPRTEACQASLSTISRRLLKTDVH